MFRRNDLDDDLNDLGPDIETDAGSPSVTLPDEGYVPPTAAEIDDAPYMDLEDMWLDAPSGSETEALIEAEMAEPLPQAEIDQATDDEL